MQRQFRKWKAVDHDEFRSALLNSELCGVSDLPTTADDYFERYERVLRRLADEFAPVTSLSRRRQRLAHWMDAECFQLRRQSRRLQKVYGRTQSSTDRLAWVQHERKRHAIYRKKEYAYRNLRLSKNASSSKKTVDHPLMG